jgi:putative transposase
MSEITTILETLRSTLSKTTWRQLIVIVEATLAMTGRVTLLGISRWAEKGGSYRTVQRFFDDDHPWSKWRWLLIQNKVKSKDCLLFGDEVVVTKSGKKTHGLGNFFHPFRISPSEDCAL